jgi:Mrp family chromosome partitioning ATPase
MDWFLVSLAEIWKLRMRVVLPLLAGILFGVLYATFVPPQYEAKAVLQLKAEEATAPLLQHISDAGNQQTLYNMITDHDLLADAAHDAKQAINASNVTLKILNDRLLAIGYRSADRANLESVVDSISYNFIQALLTPERMQKDQALSSTQAEQKRVEAELAREDISDDMKAALTAQLKALHSDEIKLRDGLKKVSLAAGQRGGETLIWFAQPATLTPPMAQPLRIIGGILLGGLLGLAVGYGIFSSRKHTVRLVTSASDASELSGMPLVGILPWLGKLHITPQGLRIQAMGKMLNPADFSEVGRLQRAIMRGLPGPLAITGIKGGEGGSTLALLLAEKTAQSGKKVILVDLNLKTRTLSTWLGLGDGNWELPSTKGEGKTKATQPWNALHTMVGNPNLQTLAAPRHPHTLQALAEAGGLPVLFDYLAEQAEVVIIDASPLAALNRGNVDAVAVSVASGRTVLMAQGDETKAEDLKRAADTLLLSGAPLLGVVLNQQYQLSRRQVLGQLADALEKVLPFLGRRLRKAAANARLD